ncbi:hypothetical protein MIR68_008026 [Amoeboaphelidium protococcarum]|nr:hypothetical protein MIR68_008026 [Amoeboaphelidium protococcarum]
MVRDLGSTAQPSQNRFDLSDFGSILAERLTGLCWTLLDNRLPNRLFPDSSPGQSGNKSYVMASEVWYSPMFGYNLFPVNKFSKTKEMSAFFNNGQVIVKNQNEVIATAELQDNGDMEDLFVMKVKVVTEAKGPHNNVLSVRLH